tara:strand:+ start:985 stop:1218 length:234 start_codon:yes stop_codon:yes gene_type:complete
MLNAHKQAIKSVRHDRKLITAAGIEANRQIAFTVSYILNVIGDRNDWKNRALFCDVMDLLPLQTTSEREQEQMPISP